MGNFTSCCHTVSYTATLLDTSGNLRRIKLPITVAEIMLDEPGHVVSPAQQVRRTFVLPAMKADEVLSAGKLFLLVPANRANSKVSGLEMALIDSAQKKRQKGRSSKVLPAVTEASSEEAEGAAAIAISQGNATGLTGRRLGCPRTPARQWRPELETISEGI
ncbi:hypothetical protein NMG60_11013765 [Bertholletia excelsa]